MTACACQSLAARHHFFSATNMTLCKAAGKLACADLRRCEPIARSLKKKFKGCVIKAALLRLLY
jgi:hypothetical protein